MINVASIYHFSLLRRISQKQRNILTHIQGKIEQYLTSEGISYTVQKKQVGDYSLIYLKLEKDIGAIQFFHHTSRKRKLYYFPYMFCEIYLDKSYLQTNNSLKKSIFLLSNIFECFDEFEEKNLLIEFHRDIEKVYNKDKEYSLRYDFININSLLKIYTEKNISQSLKNFIKHTSKMHTMSSIKNNFPDIYRTLLFFVYNIFAMQKSLLSTDEQIAEIQKFKKDNGENQYISISEERLKINHASLKKTLNIYQTNFENFIYILTHKKRGK